MEKLLVLNVDLSCFDDDKIERVKMNFLKGGDGGMGGQGDIPPPTDGEG